MTKLDENMNGIAVKEVLFPLLSTLIPTWLQNMEHKVCLQIVDRSYSYRYVLQ